MSGALDLGPLADVRSEIWNGLATLIFTRTLCHRPERVWRALVEPSEQLEWLPFVSDRPLDSLGPARLRMTDDSADTGLLDGEVLEADFARLLVFRWGEDVLTWDLQSDDTNTVLILRHTTTLPDHLSSFAAGWHVCIAVLDRFLESCPVGRIVGLRAIRAGAPELKALYSARLGLPKND
ncbi:SRPBCC domain-containing protein [Rhodobacter sp. SY28-1]|uniref:SRPBCC domain-containing protein n=1 Tax=Rhodobacter sp. SY28-1 TaxID=2562317 RepID=UPI0010BFABB1|nr:SRPBCC domain-containing protein [Rhodobacter sp. SY28-1]